MALDGHRMVRGFNLGDFNRVVEVDLASGGSGDLAYILDRHAEVVDVVVASAVGLSAGSTVEIGKTTGTGADANYFVSYSSATVSGNTALSVSNGGLSWASTADTEVERKLSIGDKVTYAVSAGGTGKVFIGVVVRPLTPPIGG